MSFASYRTASRSFCAFLASLALPLATSAEITGIIGDMVEIAPPPSVQEEALVTTTTFSIFPERQNFVLPANVTVDILGVGLADTNPMTPAPTAGVIPAGTRVDVYLVHFDTPQNTIRTLVGEVSFDTEVLGAIHTDDGLDASDFLGAIGTSYPNGVEFRGAVGGLEGADFVQVVNTPDGPRNVRVNTNVEFVLDQVRIITAATVVPEPATLGLLSIGLAGMAAIRRRFGFTASPSSASSDPQTA